MTRRKTTSTFAIMAAAATLTLTLLPSEVSAEFGLVRQCESPTATAWWSTALYEDDDNDLFRQESFPDNGTWPAESELSPGIRDCFGSGTPHSQKVLLHWVLKRPEAEVEQPHPILLVPGAGDNGKRVFTFMAYALAFEGYNVFALTFAQPNGDNYQHAEQVGNALAAISDLYGGVEVDVVAHSMGGIATWIHAAHDGSVEWGLHGDDRGAAYSNFGTHYQGNVRRLVILGTPLGGVDTAFRWPNVNYTRVLETPVNAPISWDTYYPATTANLLLTDDLTPYGYFAEEDYYPGQAQTLSRWDEAIALPGGVPELGLMAYQQDWYTTYNGGLGFYSDSSGIDDAIDQGGRLMDKLQGAGVDPDIEIHLAYGLNPILPLEYGAMFTDEDQRESYGQAMEDDWDRLERQWLDDEMPYHEAWGDDVLNVFDGMSIIGELSAPSDGIVFMASATHTEPLTLKGAEIASTREFTALNHLELAFAGRLAAFFFDPDEGTCTEVDLCDPRAVAKYDDPDNQVVEWVDSVLWTEVEDDNNGMGGTNNGTGGTNNGTGGNNASNNGTSGGTNNDTAGTNNGTGGDANNASNNAAGSNNGTGGDGVDADNNDTNSQDDGDGGGDPNTPATGTRSRDGCSVAPGEGGPIGVVLVVLGLMWGVVRERR